MAKPEFSVTVSLESSVTIVAILFMMNVVTTVKKSLTASLNAPIQERVVLFCLQVFGS